MNAKKDFEIGDHVRVINDTLQGEVVKIEKGFVTISCEDGFEYSFAPLELLINKEWNPEVSHAETKEIDTKQTSKTSFKVKKGSFVKEVDLHIHELIDHEKGMSNFDKLSLQLNVAKKELEQAISKKHPKIIFIHGRGEGVLKNELKTLLKNYNVAFHDASYLEYGQGATEVIIYQNTK
ncbi:Smr/MutS family protein [Lutimonas sp.]|uniref:Smr/MutS family protein n=1 Tax=Lutimonas sp. TaxID=1872403 RepID=UPI003D9BAE84